MTVETLRRNNILRVSNAGLRFKPTTETYALLGQAAPVDAGWSTGARAPAAGPAVMNARLASAAPFGTAGRVWLLVGGALTPIQVRLGAGDGSYTELLDAPLAEGTEVVSSVVPGQTTTKQTTTPATTNPFLGTQPRIPMGPPPAGPRPG